MTDPPPRIQIHPMDALSDLLRAVGLTGGVFIDAEFSAPWCLSGKVLPDFCKSFMDAPERVVAFHYVVEGDFVLTLESGLSWRLGGGEVVLLPHNDLHVFANEAGIPPVSVAQLMESSKSPGISRIVYGGGGACTHMICGFLGGAVQLHPLLAGLPPVMTLNLASLPSGDWMARTFDYAARTLRDGDPGAAAVAARASELMFIEALRRHIATLPPNETGWLAGLRDPAIGRALSLMHADIRNDWTTQMLAYEAHLSRSAFADRFTALLGVPPMHYLTNWRMQVAMQKLRETRLTIAQIAFLVGYESEASFTRAFRREVGSPPANWRRKNAPI